MLSQVKIVRNFKPSNVYTSFHKSSIAQKNVIYIKVCFNLVNDEFMSTGKTHTSIRIQSICCYRNYSSQLYNGVYSLKHGDTLHMQFNAVNNSGFYVTQKS